MCTVIPKSIWNKPSIAKKDIIVFKKCRKDEEQVDVVISSYTKFHYIKGNLYQTFFNIDEYGCPADEIEVKYRDLLYSPFLYIRQGFHSFKSLRGRENLLLNELKRCNCKFIIPQGSEYYQNKCGNIVSNQIIFKEIIS